MKKVRVLLADAMSSKALEVLKNRNIEAVQPGKLSVEELTDMIADFDGLAVRSATKVTPELVKAAKKLRIVGRAGIGIDNIDLATCTENGIVVMNTPFGNAITTAEHSLAMMFALARHIPQANATTHAGKWAKSLYTGMELTGKKLGIIGSGNIGSIVAAKAIAFGLKVQAYDPYLTEERATAIGVTKVDLEELLSSSDIVSLHVPKTPDTANIIDATAMHTMKKGALLINCARGGLVDEAALRVALESGHIKGAALDVFSDEPAKDNILFGLDNVICTPHLGAATIEAQEKVAIEIAEQIADYLLEGSIVNALNAANLSAEEARKLKPYLQLAHYLGSFVGQMTDCAVTKVTITYSGYDSSVNLSPLTNQIIESMLVSHNTSVNTINARQVAQDRGIQIAEVTEDSEEVYHNRMTVAVRTSDKVRAISGTLIQGMPRIVEIKGIKLESELGQHMIYITNKDIPGVIGSIGKFALHNNINIANMHLGRRNKEDDAIALLKIDDAIDAKALEELKSIEHISDACYLQFTDLLL